MIAAAWKYASADKIPPCAPPAGVSERSFPDDIPMVLRKAVKDKFGEVVAPGEKFDSTDVVFTGRTRRAIFAWERGTRWIIATEHGGRGYNDPILAFELVADGSQAKLVAERIAFPDSVCSTALTLLENGIVSELRG